MLWFSDALPGASPKHSPDFLHCWFQTSHTDTLHAFLIGSIFLPFPLIQSQAPQAKRLLVPQISLALSQSLFFLPVPTLLPALTRLVLTVLVCLFSPTTPCKPQAHCVLSSAGLHYCLDFDGLVSAVNLVLHLISVCCVMMFGSLGVPAEFLIMFLTE